MELEVEEIRVIELHMMDTKKYYPLTMLSGLSTRAILYPLTLIRTRLQVQDGKSVYNGTFDAFVKIIRNEGVSGLYRGIGVSLFQIFPSLLYITMYENMRIHLLENTRITDSLHRSLLAGCSASCASQLLVVPLDVVSQHLMLLGQRRESENETKKVKVEKKLQTLRTINISDEAKHKRFGAVSAIIREVYKQNGVFGFYKGFGASLAVFMPSSGAWWYFYDLFGGLLVEICPDWVPRMSVNCIAAPLAGCCATILTNPLDLIRTRMQVIGQDFRTTYQVLWRNERWLIFTKGLTARIPSSCIFSVIIILGYESLKRLSLKEEFKGAVRW